MRSYCVAASGIQGNPPKSHVRVHSMITHTPASPSIATNRTGVVLPIILGIVHHAARKSSSVQVPMINFQQEESPQVTGWSQLRLIVHERSCAANIVHARP